MHPGCMYTVCVCACVPVLRVGLGPAVLTVCDFPSRAVQPRPQQVFGDNLPDSQDGEQPGPSRRKRQPSMSETMPLYTLCKEDLESMDKEVSPHCPLSTGGGLAGRDWSACGQHRGQVSDPTQGPRRSPVRCRQPLRGDVDSLEVRVLHVCGRVGLFGAVSAVCQRRSPASLPVVGVLTFHGRNGGLQLNRRGWITCEGLVKVVVGQSCLTVICGLWPTRLLCPWNPPGTPVPSPGESS